MCLRRDALGLESSPVQPMTLTATLLTSRRR
jgi:hypothetical protein